MSSDNPFEGSGSGESGSVVDVLKRVISAGDINSLALISNNSSPKHYGLVLAKAEFADKYGGVGAGDFRRMIVTKFLCFEVGFRGKSNRADKVIDASKALLQQLFEVQKSQRGGLVP